MAQSHLVQILLTSARIPGSYRSSVQPLEDDPASVLRNNHCRHNTLVSCDSGDMSSQQGRSSPARFHCMIGLMLGLASCPTAISSGVQPGSLAWPESPHSLLCTVVTDTGRGLVPVLPSWSVLERNVVGVDHLDPSCWLSYWVFTPVQPAHSTVIRPYCDLLPIEVTLEVFADRAVPLFAPLQRLTEVGDDTLLPVLNLGQHRSCPDITRVGVEVPQPLFPGKP